MKIVAKPVLNLCREQHSVHRMLAWNAINHGAEATEGK